MALFVEDDNKFPILTVWAAHSNIKALDPSLPLMTEALANEYLRIATPEEGLFAASQVTHPRVEPK
jgi:hypothetical protein